MKRINRSEQIKSDLSKNNKYKEWIGINSKYGLIFIFYKTIFEIGDKE